LSVVTSPSVALLENPDNTMPDATTPSAGFSPCCLLLGPQRDLFRWLLVLVWKVLDCTSRVRRPTCVASLLVLWQDEDDVWLCVPGAKSLLLRSRKSPSLLPRPPPHFFLKPGFSCLSLCSFWLKKMLPFPSLRSWSEFPFFLISPPVWSVIVVPSRDWSLSIKAPRLLPLCTFSHPLGAEL